MKRIVTIALLCCLYTFSYAQKTCRIYLGWNDGINQWPRAIVPLDSIKEEMSVNNKKLRWSAYKLDTLGKSYEKFYVFSGLKNFRIAFGMDYNVLDDMSVVQTTTSSITVKCKVINTSSTLKVGFECAENREAPLYLDFDNIKTTSTYSNGEFTTTFNGLKSCTQYCIRPYAIVDGKKYYGSCEFPRTDLGVTIEGVSNIGANSATLMVNVEKLPETGTIGVMYGTDKSFTSGDEGKVVLTTDGYRSVKLSGLLANTTYYYRTYALINDKYYYGDTKSFTTIKDYYEVGDVYPMTGSPQGIVFDVYSNGKSGKIVSLDKKYLQWGANALVGYYYGNTNSINGSYNSGPTDLDKAYGWCVAHGSGWYLPARNELKIIGQNVDKINQQLRALGYSEIGGTYYWSSTEYSGNHAYIVKVGDGLIDAEPSGRTVYNSKTENHYVVAVKEF